MDFQRSGAVLIGLLLALAAAAQLDAETLTIEKVSGLSATVHPHVATRTPDGNLWFVDERFTPHAIGYFTPSGTVTTFPIPCDGCADATNLSYVEWMTPGPDGNVWFVWSHVRSDGAPLNNGMNTFVGRVTPSGSFTSFPMPTKDAFRRYAFGAIGYSSIVAGPDGNLWFVEYPADKVGTITPSGTITEYALPAFSSPSSITSGSDGNLWFTEPGSGKIAKVTTAGTITHYTVGPTIGTGSSSPFGLTTGADGNLWFTDRDGKIGKITTAGQVTRSVVVDGNTRTIIARGPDDNLYFSAFKGSTPYVAQLKPSALAAASGIASASGPSPLDSPAVTLTPFPDQASTQIGPWPPTGIFLIGITNEGGTFVDWIYKGTIPGLQPDPCENFAVTGDPINKRISVTVGTDLQFTATGTGGTPPYSYFIISTPHGMSESADQKTVSGKPTETELDEVIIRVKDSSNPPCEEDFTWVISASPAPPKPTGEPPSRSTKGNQPNAGAGGDPVSTSTGELFFAERADLSLGGPLPLTFRRTYGSRISIDANVLSTLGTNWVHNFDVALLRNGDRARLVLEGGRAVDFQKSGSWNLVTPSETAFQLVEDGGGFVAGDPLAQRLWLFDANGHLTGIEDGRGNHLTVTWASEHIAQVDDGLGRALTFSYDGNGLLSGVSDGARTVTFAHSGGNLTAVVDSLGNTTSYQYATGSALLQKKTYPMGNARFTQTWDAQRRVTAQTSGGGNTSAMNYSGGQTSVTDESGATRSHAFSSTPSNPLTTVIDEGGKSALREIDANGRTVALTDQTGARATASHASQSGALTEYAAPDGTRLRFGWGTRSVRGIVFYDVTSMTLPDGSSESYTLDASGNVVQRRDRGGKVWSATFNARGQALTMTNPLGGVTTMVYNADGTLQKMTDPDGVELRVGYDARRRPITMTFGDNSVVSMTWDARDRMTSHTDERGNTWTFAWDRNDNLLGVTDPFGKSRGSTYDALDRIVTTTDRTGGVTQVQYGEIERPVAITSPTGNVTTLEYDARQRLAAMVDGAGKRWTFLYDDAGYALGLTDPLGRSDQRVRNAFGNTTDWRDPLGNSRGWTYDSVQRVTKYTDPVGRVTSLTYDSRGLPSSQSGPGPSTVTYVHDDLGNVTEVEDARGETWRFTFSTAGRLLSSRDPLARTTAYEYDQRGRMDNVRFADNSTAAITFDKSGNATRRKYSSGPDLQFQYDAAGRMTSAAQLTHAFDAEGRVTATTSGGRQYGAAYDAAGRLKSVSYEGSFEVQYAYDGRDRVTSVKDTLTGTTVNLTWDDAGRLVSITRPNNVSTTMTRDGAGRLTRLVHGSFFDVQYAYNAAADVTGENGTMPIDPGAAAAVQAEIDYSADAAAQSGVYAHDTRGRVTKVGTQSLSWDGASRMTAAGGVTYEYDGLGRMISRKAGDTTTTFHYNDAIGPFAAVAERSDSKTTRWYVYLPDGRLLYAIDPQASNAVSHYHFDRAGSTIALTDQNGNVTDAWAYDPFGRVLQHTGPSKQPFTYVGLYATRLDSDTGLCQMGWRWYDPAMGRYLTQDSQRGITPESINPYLYARGNPITWGDPFGLSAKKQIDEFFQDKTGLKPGDIAGATEDAADVFEEIVDEVGDAVKGRLNAGDIPGGQRLGRKFLKLRKVGKYVEKVGKTAGYVAKGLGAWEEYEESNQKTRLGRGASAAAVTGMEFFIDYAEDKIPVYKIINDVSGIVDNVTDLTATYAEVDIKAPKVTEVMKAPARIAGALVDAAASGNTQGLDALSDRMTSGQLGGFSGWLSNTGIAAGDGISTGTGILGVQGWWETLNPLTLAGDPLAPK